MFSQNYPVTCNTNNVSAGCTFVAIKGFTADGNAFIKRAIELGAKKIVSDQLNTDIINFCKLNNIEFIHVKNARKALAQLSAKSLKINKIKTKIIGITGTKGKTSTTYIIDFILKYNNFKTALIGTIANKILDKKFETINTTPDSDYLHMFLSECDKNNINYLIMEVSAHALSLHRVNSLKFDAIGFTNLAHEHLDYYKNIKNYFKAKLKIFSKTKKSSFAVINTDNIWGQKTLEIINTKYKTKKNLINLDKNIFNKIKNFIPSCMPGEFNLYNFGMSYLICKNLGLQDNEIFNAMQNFSGVPGRLQLHTLKNGARAFVDYAHNPSSMEEVLKTLRPLTNNLITVFGCGGNRDKEKRPIMGNIATKYSDSVIITDDNPRFEDPKIIIQEILTGINKSDLNKIKIISDRKLAIAQAVKISGPNSIIAILGKGHEDYHLVAGQKFHFDDFEEICKF